MATGVHSAVTSGLDSTSSNDLWLKAIESLAPEERSSINFSYDKLTILTDIEKETKAAHQKSEQQKWCYRRRNGSRVVLADVFGKVSKWIQLFKEVGDTIVQYDPGHAALPWAGVRFLLQVCSLASGEDNGKLT